MESGGRREHIGNMYYRRDTVAKYSSTAILNMSMFRPGAVPGESSVRCSPDSGQILYAYWDALFVHYGV